MRVRVIDTNLQSLQSLFRSGGCTDLPLFVATPPATETPTVACLATESLLAGSSAEHECPAPTSRPPGGPPGPLTAVDIAGPTSDAKHPTALHGLVLLRTAGAAADQLAAIIEGAAKRLERFGGWGTPPAARGPHLKAAPCELQLPP